MPSAGPDPSDYPFAARLPQNLPPIEPSERPTREPWLALIAWIVAGLLADFEAFPLTKVFSPHDLGALLVYGAAGMITAQWGVFAAVLVWTPGPFWRRLTLHGAAVGLMFFLWLTGARLTQEPEFVSKLTTLGFLLPLISLAVQLPLWVMRQYFSWRLVREGSDPRLGKENLSIRDLFAATLVVAVSLALLRVAERSLPDVVFGMAVALPMITLVSTIAVLPVAGLILAWQRWPLGLAVILCETLAATLVVFVAVEIWEGFSPAMSAWELFGMLTMIVSFAAMLSAAALAARAAGYRLVTGSGSAFLDERASALAASPIERTNDLNGAGAGTALDRVP